MATSEEALRREIDSLKADLTALRADLKDLGKDVSSAARAGAEAAKDRVKSAMHAAKEHGQTNQTDDAAGDEGPPVGLVGEYGRQDGDEHPTRGEDQQEPAAFIAVQAIH